MRWQNLSIWQIIAIAALLVGVVMLPFGVVSQVHNQHFRDTAKQTQSLSISQSPVGGTNGATIIKFSYRVNGLVYNAQQSGPDFNEHLTNQTVLYNPADPSQAKLANQKLTNEGMVFGLSIFFIALALVIIFIQKLAHALRSKSQK